jgi:hypothetical protein
MSHLPPNRPWDLPANVQPPVSVGHRRGVRAAYAVAAVLGVVVTALVTGPNSYGEVADRRAARNCETGVLQRLMTSGTTHVARSGQTIRRESGGGWVITGTMTQRNTYGASWSSSYRCDLTPQGDVDRLAVRPLR